MLKKDVRELIIAPSLKAISLWDEAAEILVYATGLKETHYNYLKQAGGSALGFYQCESYTYKAIKTWLTNRMNQYVLDRILAACYMNMLPLDEKVLMWDLRFASIICRIHYFKINKPLPSPKDAAALCEYYLKYYNTALGKSTFENSIQFFEQAVSGVYE